MRIAYVPTRYPVVSETFITLEISELRTAGHTVDVISIWEGDADDGDGTSELIWQGTATVSLLAAHVRTLVRHPRRYLSFVRLGQASGWEPEACWRHLPWWAEELRRRGTQVLHAHFAWSSATRAWGLSLLSGIPWVVTAHAHDIFASPQRLAEKLTAADAAITVCEYNRLELTALGVTRPVDVVVCGVSDPGPPQDESTGPDIAFVGRLVPKKGADLLLDALALLAEGGRSPSVSVIGDGPELERLRDRAEASGLHEVTFHGALSHDRSLEVIASAAVFCLPARIAADGDRDSMPVVIKEAMVRARPVVSTNVVAIPEMVDQDVGWLVQPDDAEALAGALEAALVDGNARAARGAAARRRALSRFLERDQVELLTEVYERVVADRRRS